jgi:predicted transcriptional regulator
MAADRARTQGAIGRMLGVSQPAVRAWLLGLSRPDQMLRDALELLCGIPAEHWELESERARRDATLERIRADSPGESAEHTALPAPTVTDRSGSP